MWFVIRELIGVCFVIETNWWLMIDWSRLVCNQLLLTEHDWCDKILKCDQNPGSLLAPVIVSSSPENIPLLNIIFPACMFGGVVAAWTTINAPHPPTPPRFFESRQSVPCLGTTDNLGTVHILRNTICGSRQTPLPPCNIVINWADHATAKAFNVM